MIFRMSMAGMVIDTFAATAVLASDDSVGIEKVKKSPNHAFGATVGEATSTGSCTPQDVEGGETAIAADDAKEAAATAKSLKFIDLS